MDHERGTIIGTKNMMSVSNEVRFLHIGGNVTSIKCHQFDGRDHCQKDFSSCRARTRVIRETKIVPG